MTKNKIFSLILAVCSIFIFCGCANIEYQRVTDDTGQIFDKLIIELDEEEILQKMSYDELTLLKKDIKKDLEDYVVIINYLRPQLQAKYPDMDFSEGIVAKTIPWVYTEDNVSRISIEILYKNAEYLNKLNGTSADAEKEDNNEIISNLFISKYMMYSDNAFKNLEEMGVGGVPYFQRYTSKYSDFTIADVELTQVYGTTDKRLQSNADYKTTIDGINYHLWEIDTKQGGYNTMQTSYYYRTAVGTGWYILALALSFSLAIILIIVYIVKSRRDKKYKQLINLENNISNRLDGEE